MAVDNATTNVTNTSLPVYIMNVSYWEQILLAILLELVAIAGLIGNSMIIAAVAFSKKLQTSTNAFVTSLSITDLLTSFTLIWYTISLLGKNEWPIPGAYWICKFTGFMVYACVGTSMLTLGMIGINRLIHISKPMWYQKIFTSWKLVILVLIPWVIPTVSLLISTATGDVAFGYNKPSLVCAVYEHTDLFVIAINAVGLLFPLLAIVSYSMQSSSADLAITEEGHDPNHSTAGRRRKQISKQEIAITKNLFVVVVGFLVCFLPYLILLSIRNAIDAEHYRFYIRVGPFFNSAINFMIYASKHPDFKVVLRHMMRCSYADIPQPSPILKYILSKN
ncbi:beta-2 adrenergic receptor-like [Amphiura filiformis]|uniref:beta-2 adrenergic receptor-like n=1 Tax=Amphiura filiformis TaxID=82378 RepID=UPI003B20E83A